MSIKDLPFVTVEQVVLLRQVAIELEQRAEAAEAKLREMEVQEPVLWLEAEPSAKNEHPRDVIESMVCSTRLTKEKPTSTVNVCWPLYAKPFPSKQEEK